MGRAALTSLWLTFLGLTSAEPIKIEAESGGTAHLPCQIASTIKVVEWSRPDLNPECVLLYQNKQFDPDSQNPSFKDRAILPFTQIKKGNLTLILENVKINDTGTYECRVLTNRRKRAVEPISIIRLRVVDPPGQTGGHTEDGGKEDGGKEDGRREDGPVRLMVGLSVCAVLVSVIVGFLTYRKHKQQQSEDSYQSPPEQDGGLPL